MWHFYSVVTIQEGTIDAKERLFDHSYLDPPISPLDISYIYLYMSLYTGIPSFPSVFEWKERLTFGIEDSRVFHIINWKVLH